MLVGQEKLVLVQGLVSLPRGYAIQRCQGIPAISVHYTRGALHVQCHYNITENIIALAQILFGIISLYQSRGSQLDKFGVGAFSLTVLPFGPMSLGNLLAKMVSPDHALLYLIESEEMEEPVGRGAIVATVAGRLIKAEVLKQ